MEIWKDIENYEGLYQVSNLGNVKSLNYRHTGKERILSPGKDKKGYLYVVLYKNRKPKTMLIHRLVASAFIDNPNNLPEVNHIDEDKENNTVGNLEWCDREYNLNYGTRTQKTCKKVFQYSLDGKLIKVWESTNECGRNGFIRSAVSSCCNNKYPTHKGNIYKGFIWSYTKF